jgi:hypothetical protein
MSKLKRAFCSALAGILVLTAWTSAQGAPLATITMEGRRAGSGEAWTRFVIRPSEGEVVEYRLVADMAPVGAMNAQGTIFSFAEKGLQSLSLAIEQAPTDLTQVDFGTPLAVAQAFRNGWGDGTGASSGTLSPRPGGSWNDLREIRPIHSPGVFSAADPEVILQGTFTVAEFGPVFAGPVMATLMPTWGTDSGTMRINGVGEIAITPNDQAGADPLVAFEPLLLVTLVPEPSTILLSAMGLAGFVVMVHRRRGGGPLNESRAIFISDDGAYYN